MHLGRCSFLLDRSAGRPHLSTSFQLINRKKQDQEEADPSMWQVLTR